jgi:hypothetical protein
MYSTRKHSKNEIARSVVPVAEFCMYTHTPEFSRKIDACLMFAQLSNSQKSTEIFLKPSQKRSNCGPHSLRTHYLMYFWLQIWLYSTTVNINKLHLAAQLAQAWSIKIRLWNSRLPHVRAIG